MRPVILRVKIARPEDVGRFVAEGGEGCEVVFYDWESQAIYNNGRPQAAPEPEPEPEEQGLITVVHCNRLGDLPAVGEALREIDWDGTVRIKCGSEELVTKAQYRVNSAVTDSEKTDKGRVLRSQTVGSDVIVSKMSKADALRASLPSELPFGANETDD